LNQTRGDHVTTLRCKTLARIRALRQSLLSRVPNCARENLLACSTKGSTRGEDYETDGFKGCSIDGSINSATEISLGPTDLHPLSAIPLVAPTRRGRSRIIFDSGIKEKTD